ncbi:hypothetical protein AGR13a_Lc110175 [Agrobacterium genomosp. 13 str. CFBP 6927]|uniref:Uncharacterized protein n=1 Tax=Agrobacterium genomosp. 13 str. CFBP 6927 TaxID=1183428 RepID=A0ABM9VJH8_9HYPH|nr:hypothetical protein AGR13a_Lc110175 [Agrobacterium genomosp. 13 str. CFBP 6927]
MTSGAGGLLRSLVRALAILRARQSPHAVAAGSAPSLVKDYQVVRSFLRRGAGFGNDVIIRPRVTVIYKWMPLSSFGLPTRSRFQGSSGAQIA